MREVDFYKLSRPVQDQLVASVRGRAAPMPIATEPATSREPLAWLGLAAGGLVLLVLLWAVGAGALASGAAIHGAGVAPAWALAVGAMVAGVLRAAALVRAAKRSPVPPGTYAFAGCVVDARGPKLRVVDTAELVAVEPATTAKGTAAVRLVFPDRVAFTFGVVEVDQVGAVERALDDGKQQRARAQTAGDPRGMAAVDPLYDSAFSSPLGPSEPLKRREPPWARLFWAFGFGAGLVLGPLHGWARNARSDERMFETAKQQDDVASWRAYLERRASRHEVEVTGKHLPRAELREAQHAGTVAAIQAYAAAHPRTQIQKEIDAALHAAMLAELEEAKKQGTLAALKDFATRHPAHGVDAELRQATHAVYTAALERYRARAPEKDGEHVAAFVERLLAWAETKGPRVEVRFRRKTAKSMAKADAAVAKSRNFSGVNAIPSRYFDAAHAAPREQALVAGIAGRFAEVFPAELVDVVAGEPLADPDAPPPAAIVPTFFVEHIVEWSGTTYPVKEPRGIFAGAIFGFDGTFRLPDGAGAKPVKVKLDLWRPADVSVFHEEKKEARVYEVMGKDAFDQYAKKVGSTFFRPSPKR